MDDNTAAKAVVALEAGVVDAWLARQSSPNTRAAYRIDLTTFGRWCAQHQAVALTTDTRTLVAFQLARQAAGDSEATMRRRWSSLSSFYQFAIDAGLTTTNPVAGVHRPQVPTGDLSPTAVLSPQTVHEYRAMAMALDPRLNALVSLIVLDGLKVGEALALDVDDITGRPPTSSLSIRRGRRSRRVVLNRASARAVRRCAGRRWGQPLFTSARPDPTTAAPRRLTRYGADHLLRQLSHDGNDRVTANELRRYYITSNNDAGADIDQLRQNAGLANTRSVRRYLTTPTNAPVDADIATPPARSSSGRQRMSRAGSTERRHPDPDRKEQAT